MRLSYRPGLMIPWPERKLYSKEEYQLHLYLKSLILTLILLTLKLDVFSPRTKLMASIKLDFPEKDPTENAYKNIRWQGNRNDTRIIDF